MTTREMLLCIAAYAVVLAIAIYFTRAGPRRVVGALAGGAAAGALAMAMIALGESRGWWQIPWATTPYFKVMLYVGLAFTMSPVYLATWRIARRFGWRGLAVSLAAAAVIGPPRDYLYATLFPKWMVFSPDIAPALWDAATYVGMVAAGHAAMRLVAGPAGEDRLVRQP